MFYKSMATQKITKTALTNALRRANDAIEELKVLKGDYAIQSATESSADFLITRKNKTLVRVIRGPEGKTGGVGLHGAAGGKGNRGEKGIKGDQGVKGQQGGRGFTGNRGERGDIGEKGVSGHVEVGDRGEIGGKGEKGEHGERGEVGTKGIDGKKGDVGLRGVSGLTGTTGERGDQGFQGIKGELGSTGRQGEVGKAGLKGDIADSLIETRVIAGVVEFRVRSERLYKGKIRWTGWIHDLEKLINELKSLGGGGTNIISFQPFSVKEEGTKVGGDDINTIDFGAGFDITESPDKQINVVLDTGELPAGGEISGTLEDSVVDIVHSGSPHHEEPHAHALHSGITPDAHHPQSHTILSHSDTSATGSQLNIVTDGSEVNLLHTHRLTTYITIGSETGDGISYSL